MRFRHNMGSIEEWKPNNQLNMLICKSYLALSNPLMPLVHGLFIPTNSQPNVPMPKSCSPYLALPFTHT